MTDALTERLVTVVAELRGRVDALEHRDPWTVGRVDYPHVIFAEMSIDSGATGKYMRIASLPATGAGTGDSVVIEFFGGKVGSANQFRGVIRTGNRTAFSAYLEWLSGDTAQLTYARVVAYTNSGVTTWYLYLPGTTWAFVAAQVMKSGWGGTVATLYPGEASSTSTPGGSLAFDSFTASPLLTQTNAGDLYSVPWTDYSGTSTIVGWSSFTTKKIYYKKIGKLVFVDYNLDGTSDNTALTFTLPYATSTLLPDPTSIIVWAMNNGVANTGYVRIPANSSTVTFYRDVLGNTWTAANRKYVLGQFFYEAA
jgi:hypothetical protein